jgi:two-component system invasion response regulator UvrY
MRILLADNQARVRFALRVLLERQPGLEVVDEAASSEQVAARAARSSPDLVLLDWTMATASGSDLLLALRRDCPGLGIIILSGRPEAREAALAAGADAFVSKGNPPEELLSAIARLSRDGEAPTMGNLASADALAL